MARINIIGGGPSGLTNALFLASKGHQIKVFERGIWPIDKVCGEGIMPSGHQILQDLGVIKYLDPNRYQLFDGIDYINLTGKKIEGRFYQKDKGIAIGRKNLSQALHRRCQDFSNIALFQDAKVVEVIPVNNGVETFIGNVKHLSDYVILSDGIRSPFRKKLGLDKPICSKQKRLGARAHYPLSPWSNKVEVYWGKNIEAYITPIGKKEIQLAFLWDHNKVSIKNSKQFFFELISYFPTLDNLFKGITPIDSPRSYGPFQTMASTCSYKNILLTGDVRYFLDGITGEGLSLAFKQSKYLADNFTGEVFNNKRYKLQINTFLLNYEFLTRFALFNSRNAKSQKLMFIILNMFPAFFSFMLALNDGPTRLPSFFKKIYSGILKMFSRDFDKSKQKANDSPIIEKKKRRDIVST